MLAINNIKNIQKPAFDDFPLKLTKYTSESEAA